MEQVELMPLLGEEIRAYLQENYHRIHKAAEYSHGTFDVNDWLQWVLEGKLLLLTVKHSGDLLGEVTLEKVIYPKKRRLRVVTLSGHSIEQWIAPLAGQLRAFAKLNGFDGLEATMRPGLARLLWKHGYRQLLTTVTVDG